VSELAALVCVLIVLLLLWRVRELERLLERRRRVVADAAHQLRNPLQALLLRLDALPPGQARDAAVQDGRHLAGVLERLLEQPEGIERVDLARLAERRIDAWSAAARAKRMTIRRAGDARVDALVDAVAVSSALDVVLDNAVKFGPPGSTVRVSVRRECGGAVVGVQDEGPGLRRDELPRAGERHWRGCRHVEGSGLGLAIARTLLERSGGRLELRPGAPRGLEVRLSFARSNPPQIRAAGQRRGRIVRAG
jgi:signal transduction histidine kinase